MRRGVLDGVMKLILVIKGVGVEGWQAIKTTMFGFGISNVEIVRVYNKFILCQGLRISGALDRIEVRCRRSDHVESVSVEGHVGNSSKLNLHGRQARVDYCGPTNCFLGTVSLQIDFCSSNDSGRKVSSEYISIPVPLGVPLGTGSFFCIDKSSITAERSKVDSKTVGIDELKRSSLNTL
jgi:hypothetical protein